MQQRRTFPWLVRDVENPCRAVFYVEWWLLPLRTLSQMMWLVGPFHPWMQGDHVMIVILMTVVDFFVNYLGYLIMMM
ncbi:hypothetical protein P3S68_003944 [Capsicum galapagoense]